MKFIHNAQLALLTSFLLMLPHSASAYVGPGAGITAIGAVLALIGGIVLAVFGFIWYPLKRMRRARGKNATARKQADK